MRRSVKGAAKNICGHLRAAALPKKRLCAAVAHKEGRMVLLPRPGLPALLVMLMVLLSACARPVAPPSPDVVPLPRAGVTWPLSFVAAEAHTFTAATPGGALRLTPDTVTFAYGLDTLVLEFIDAHDSTTLHGVGTRSRHNRFIGAPEQWRSDIASYSAVEYQQLYVDIDLRYDLVQGRLKGTYSLAAGIDPQQIRWRYRGAQTLAIDPLSGDLLLTLPSGATLRETAPFAWQEQEGQERPVTARFALGQDGSVGFTLGAYNPALPLIIDPFLEWSSVVGGTDLEEGRDVAVDQAGNIYVVGQSQSADFPTQGPLQGDYRGGDAAFGDAVVFKLDPSGRTLLWSTYIGGARRDIAEAIALDSAGNVYITGATNSDDFPIQNAFQASRGGDTNACAPCSDAFVLKLNPGGNALIWSSYLGDSGDENDHLLNTGTRTNALGIDIDSSGNVSVTGRTNSTNFRTRNAYQSSRKGLSDLFLSMIAADGQSLRYSSYLGGDGAEYSGDVAVRGSIAYLVGSSLSSDFPLRAALQNANAGGTDIVVARVDTSKVGDASLLSSSYLGGSDSDYAFAVALEGSAPQAVAIGGYSSSDDFPLVSAFQTGLAGNRDVVLARFDAAVSALGYSSYLGGQGVDVAYDIDIGRQSAITLVGSSSSADFPTKEAWQVRLNSGKDAIIARIDPVQSGAASLVYSSYLGSNVGDEAYGLALDGAGDAYITGVSVSALLGARIIGPNESGDAILVAKFGPQAPQRVYLPLVRR
jgi:hypothetical protein